MLMYTVLNRLGRKSAKCMTQTTLVQLLLITLGANCLSSVDLKSSTSDDETICICKALDVLLNIHLDMDIENRLRQELRGEQNRGRWGKR